MMRFSTTSIFFALSILASVASSATAEPAVAVNMRQHPVAEDMNPEWQTRIKGGQYVDRADHPYFVSLGGCGGTLIAPDTVLTAAHCGDLTGKQVAVNLYDNKNVYDGGVEIRYCEEWVEHDNWDVGDYSADFALCKLDKPVWTNQLTDKEITLKWNDDPNFNVDNEELIAMGHGHVAEGAAGSQWLRYIKIKGYSQEDCRSTKMYGRQIGDSMLCAGMDDGSRDTCPGDSGGPLIKRVQVGDAFVDTLVGVASWGEGCGAVMRPGVYARVSWAADFIRETTCNDFNSIANWCGNEKEEEETCDGLLAVIAVDTDNYGGDTSWTLREKGRGNTAQVMSRKYWVNNYSNVHQVCLKKQQCYRLDLYDSYGDSLCGNGDCKVVGLGKKTRKGVRIQYEINHNWGSHFRVNFCVNKRGTRIRSKQLRTLYSE